MAVTVPGLLYLRNSGGTAQPRHGEVDLRRAEPVHKAMKAAEPVREAPQAASSVKSAAVEKMEEGIQKTQNTGMESASSTESEGAATPSSEASAQGPSAQMDQSAESVSREFNL